MKAPVFLLMCALLVYLAPAGCNNSGKSDEIFFNALVLENNQTHLLVEPEVGSSELRTADRITVSVSNAALFNSQDAEIKINSIGSGDQVQIYYDGLIAESYPAQINGCQKIKVLKAVLNGENMAGDIIFKNGFYRPDFESLPEEISNWINFSREISAVQEKIYNGYRYVLVTEGKKPSGGYGVEAVEVLVGPDSLVVKVKSFAPKKGEAVDTVITSPFDLIIVENSELPLTFADVNDPDRYFMKVLGLKAIEQPIVASSDWIKIFRPRPHELIKGAIYLSGIACVFEGTVNYDLLTEDGNILCSGFTTGTMGDWGYFQQNIPLPADIDAGLLVLRLYSASAKDGSKMYVVDIPLVLH
ncbi:MAG: protease complex subunit PrcB family protein [Clostridiaceae bacterium]|nr:protease complex subunit PrcB family protein [Clostridiaceae bacterium]